MRKYLINAERYYSDIFAKCITENSFLIERIRLSRWNKKVNKKDNITNSGCFYLSKIKRAKLIHLGK